MSERTLIAIGKVDESGNGILEEYIEGERKKRDWRTDNRIDGVQLDIFGVHGGSIEEHEISIDTYKRLVKLSNEIGKSIDETLSVLIGELEPTDCIAELCEKHGKNMDSHFH